MYLFWIKMEEPLGLKKKILPDLIYKHVFCWYKLMHMGSVMLNSILDLSKTGSVMTTLGGIGMVMYMTMLMYLVLA